MNTREITEALENEKISHFFSYEQKLEAAGLTKEYRKAEYLNLTKALFILKSCGADSKICLKVAKKAIRTFNFLAILLILVTVCIGLVLFAILFEGSPNYFTRIFYLTTPIIVGNLTFAFWIFYFTVNQPIPLFKFWSIIRTLILIIGLYLIYLNICLWIDLADGENDIILM